LLLSEALHSTITLTMGHYTHTFIEDNRSALARLPSLGVNTCTTETVPATGMDNATPQAPG